MAKSINRRADFGLLVFAVGMLLLTGCGGGSSSSSSKGGTTSSTPTTTSADFVKVSVNGAPEVTYTELKTSDIYASIISNGYTIAACVPSCSTGLDFGIYFTGLTGPGTATLGTVATFYVSFMDQMDNLYGGPGYTSSGTVTINSAGPIGTAVTGTFDFVLWDMQVTTQTKTLKGSFQATRDL